MKLSSCAGYVRKYLSPEAYQIAFGLATEVKSCGLVNPKCQMNQLSLVFGSADS
jgi:hypothetical protein